MCKVICQLGQNGSEYSNLGMWSILKRGIYGVYRVVSKKYLQAYIDEYSWRYNNRKYQDEMFDRLFNQIAEVRVINSLDRPS